MCTLPVPPSRWAFCRGPSLNTSPCSECPGSSAAGVSAALESGASSALADCEETARNPSKQTVSVGNDQCLNTENLGRERGGGPPATLSASSRSVNKPTS